MVNLPRAASHYNETRRVMGEDFQPYGVKRNIKPIEACNRPSPRAASLPAQGRSRRTRCVIHCRFVEDLRRAGMVVRGALQGASYTLRSG
jgi:hypothetical protein